MTHKSMLSGHRLPAPCLFWASTISPVAASLREYFPTQTEFSKCVKPLQYWKVFLAFFDLQCWNHTNFLQKWENVFLLQKSLLRSLSLPGAQNTCLHLKGEGNTYANKLRKTLWVRGTPTHWCHSDTRTSLKSFIEYTAKTLDKFESWLQSLLSTNLWENYLTTLYLSFIIRKQGWS